MLSITGSPVQEHAPRRLAIAPRSASFGEPLQILASAGLRTLLETLPAEERSTSVFEGNAQAIDLLLVGASLQSALVPGSFDIVHVNAEYREQASDHDPQVARFLVPAD